MLDAKKIDEINSSQAQITRVSIAMLQMAPRV